MVDNVNIENVGGTRPNLGVASEATLQALLDSTNRNNRDGTGNQQSQRLQDLYNRSTRDGARNQGTLSKAVKSTTKATYNFSKELLAGGDRMSDFSDSVFGASSKLSRLIRFGERYVDTLRDLTSVGASFNNSMFDMIAASASSSMNMDDFAQMVRMNSQTLATFGSGVTNGAKIFGSFSRDFRTGVGKSLFGMGFTINDINDGLLSFLDIERRRSSQGLRTGIEQQNAAYEYIQSLDLLTKLTGKQRKEIENSMQAQVQDAGIRSQINRLDGQARRNLQETLTFLDTEMGPIGEGLKDLMDGAAQTDLGKALANQIPGITAFAQRMFAGGASLETVIEQLGNNFGPQLEKMAAGYSKAQLDQMRSIGGVTGAIAELLDNTYRLNQQRDKDVAAMREEQKQRDRLTSVFGGFEQAVINLRKSLYDAFFKLGESTGLFDAFEELGNTLSSLFTVDTGLNRLLPNLTNSLTGVFSWFAQNIKDFTAWIKEGKFQKYLDSLGEKVTATKEYFSDLIERMKTEGIWKTIKTELLKGFSNFTTSMSEFWNGPTMTNLQNNISAWFKDLIFGKEEPIINFKTAEIKWERQGGLIKTITDGFFSLFSIVKDLILGKEEAIVNMKTGDVTWERQGGLLNDAYEWLKLTMFGGTTESGEQKDGLLESAYKWVTDKLFPADKPNMTMWERISDTIMDALFGEEIDLGFGAIVRPGMLSIMAKAHKLLNEYLGLSLLEQQAGGRTLLEQVRDKIFGNEQGQESMFSKLSKKINDALFGEIINESGDRSGGLFKELGTTLANAIKNLFEKQETIDALTSMMTALGKSAIDSLTNMWENPEIKSKFDNLINNISLIIEEKLIGLMDSLNDGVLGWFIDNDELEKRKQNLEIKRAQSTITPEETAKIRQGISLDDPVRDEAALRNLSETDREIAFLKNELDYFRDKSQNPNQQAVAPKIAQLEEQLRALGVNEFNKGTNGFENFGILLP